VIPVLAHKPSAEPCKEGVNCLKTGGLLRIGWTPLPDRPGTCPRQVMCQNESEQCTWAWLIPIRAHESRTESCKEGVDCLKTGGLLQIGWTPLPDWADICPGQATHHNESEQCTRACLISIWGHEPSAGPCKKGMHSLKIGGLLRHGWTPLPDWPDTFPRQVTCQNESHQCTRACLIPIQARESSAEPYKEGVDCGKIGGLL
jgi:hypothetical protein